VDGSVSGGGGVGGGANIRAGMMSARSDRFLDPAHPDNLHNDGGQSTTFGQFSWAAESRDLLTVGWGYGRARFDVPNSEDQEEAGQDQRQRLSQAFFNASWQHTWSSALVTQAAVYHRRTGAQLEGSVFDTPLEANADRNLIRTGALVAATRQSGPHLMKFGFEAQWLEMDEAFGFHITDEDQAEEAGFREEALAFTPDNPFRFDGRATPTLWSVFAQDSWRASARLTISGGIRFDQSELLLDRSQWSPRVGAAARLTDATVVRGAVSRFFQPPQTENLLLSSSPEARVLSSISVGEDEGGADVEPERQWGIEIGLDQQLGKRVRLDVAYWQRRIEHVADPNVFAGTTIIFPNAVARGRARGIDMRLELPRHNGWSGYANWSAARVRQTGPITGGLFLEDEVEELGPGVEFVPDHDQRFAAGFGLTWEHASGVALSAVGRYETGTPVPQEDDDLEELMERPGADLVDFEAGRVESRTLFSLLATVPLFETDRVRASAGVRVLNLFDARYAYNFGNPFSGTHFGAPRTVAVTLRISFR
jgi:outer membrane receptor protein involved in Fe transport